MRMEEIGIDIINISFVKKMIKKHGNSFAKKILSEELKREENLNF